MSETKTPEQIAEDFRLAVHELGHHEACASFRIPSSPKIFEEVERYTDGGKTVVAVCIVDTLAKKTPFERSVIGWSGYLAEHLCGVAHKCNRNPFPLTPETLWDFYSAALANFEEHFSRQDQIWICAGKNEWRAFKGAYKRLLPKVEKIKRMAEVIAANFSDADRAARTVAALRDFFRRRNEMAHDDFIQLVAGGDVARFERFIVSRIALNLTSNRTTDIEEAKRVMGTSFAAEFERASWIREHYASSFKNEAEMIAAAKAYQNWMEA
jgi:hypothetical protein